MYRIRVGRHSGRIAQNCEAWSPGQVFAKFWGKSININRKMPLNPLHRGGDEEIHSSSTSAIISAVYSARKKFI